MELTHYGEPNVSHKQFTTLKDLGHEIKRQYNLIQGLKRKWEEDSKRKLSLKKMFSVVH